MEDRFAEIAALLLARWPVLFKPGNPKVLAMGVTAGLVEGLQGAVSKEEMTAFLNWWTRREEYLLAIYRKPVRWGLDERPAYSIKPGHKEEAWRQLLSRFGYTEETLLPPKRPGGKSPASGEAAATNAGQDAKKVEVKTGKAKISCTVDSDDLPTVKEGTTKVQLQIQSTAGMRLQALVKGKAYRKAYSTAKESPTGAFVVVQGHLAKVEGDVLELDGVGMVVAPKKPKEAKEDE